MCCCSCRVSVPWVFSFFSVTSLHLFNAFMGVKQEYTLGFLGSNWAESGILALGRAKTAISVHASTRSLVGFVFYLSDIVFLQNTVYHSADFPVYFQNRSKTTSAVCNANKMKKSHPLKVTNLLSSQIHRL